MSYLIFKALHKDNSTIERSDQSQYVFISLLIIYSLLVSLFLILKVTDFRYIEWQTSVYMNIYAVSVVFVTNKVDVSL